MSDKYGGAARNRQKFRPGFERVKFGKETKSNSYNQQFRYPKKKKKSKK